MISCFKMTASPGFVVLVGLAIWLPAANAQPVTTRGVVVARDEAVISVSISARIRRLPFRQGESFRRGDVLVAFDCKGLMAELAARQAVYEGRREKVQADRRLKKYQAIGSSELAISKAAMDEARARRDAQGVLVEQCIIKAPYDGRVVYRKVNEHERPQAGQPLLKVVNTSAVEVDMIVPSKWLGWLKRNTEFEFSVDETGQSLKGRIVRTGAIVDAVSQTIRITGDFSKPVTTVLPGMSGTATFSYPGGQAG